MRLYSTIGYNKLQVIFVKIDCIVQFENRLSFGLQCLKFGV